MRCRHCGRRVMSCPDPACNYHHADHQGAADFPDDCEYDLKHSEVWSTQVPGTSGLMSSIKALLEFCEGRQPVWELVNLDPEVVKAVNTLRFAVEEDEAFQVRCQGRTENEKA